MKIVVLDGYTLSPGDLSWDGLRALGEVKLHERTEEKDILPRAEHAEVVLTNKTPLNREIIRKLAHCRYIGVLATGYNVVNVDAATKRGITVTNVPGYATAGVAERVFAFLFEFLHSVSYHSHTVHQGRWAKSPDFCYWLRPLGQLAGRTMGVVGFGKTGQAVARAAAAFGMPVLVYTRHPPATAPEGVRFVELDDVFRESDVVSLHCPLTADTQHVANEYRIGLMKPTAYLINCARGGLVDEEALAAALKVEKIAGAALDVLEVEPPEARHPLYPARSCLITPHNAWATKEARTRLMNEAVENLRAFIAGTPRNVVKPA